MPIWECVCGHFKCIGSIEELKENLPKNEQGELDLHKPYIDEIKLPCEKCSKQMERIPDVLDCWFESGSMPYAQLHYPFENKTDFEQKLESMQVEHQAVEKAESGQGVGIKVSDKVREGDEVFKVV